MEKTQISQIRNMESHFQKKLELLEEQNREKEEYFRAFKERERELETELQFKSELLQKLQHQFANVARPSDQLNILADLKDLQQVPAQVPSSFRKNQKNHDKFVSIRNKKHKSEFEEQTRYRLPTETTDQEQDQDDTLQRASDGQDSASRQGKGSPSSSLERASQQEQSSQKKKPAKD